MWNGNNGNGQGNGYGQPQQGQPQQQQGYTPQGGYGQPQDAYARLDNAREVGGARFPYISAGTHKLALVSLEEFNPQAAKVRALFKTLESRTQQVGGFCVKIWAITKPPRFPNGATEGDEFADFMLKLKGAPRGFPISQSIRTLLKERPLDQLARGTVIECTGVAAGKPNPQKPNQEPYVRVYWNSIAQEPGAIVAMRQQLEQEGVPNTNENAQGQQPQQMQQQYAPQQMQPQQNYAQPPTQPQQMTQVGGYGQAPAQQPQGAPPGGFLANVPTNNPQGGNTGGGQQGGGW